MSNPLQFHILDCHIRDEIVEEETEDTKVVSYVEEHEPASQYRGRKYNENAKVVIHLFGSCANGQTIRCDVYNFEPFFYAKLPVENPNAGKRVLEEFLQNKIGPVFQTCVACKIVYKEELYGYSKHQKVPFLEIKMTSMELYYAIRNIFLYFNKERNDGKSFKKMSIGAPFKPYEAPKLFESNLDPLLRFFHLRNLSPCNWVEVKNQTCPTGVSTRDIVEFMCDFHDIRPCENPPVPTAPFVLGSWDIETWSSTGEFPLAVRNWSHIIRPFYKASSSVEEFFANILCALRHETDLPTDCYKLILQDHNPLKIQKLEKTFGKYSKDSALQKCFPQQKITAKVRDSYMEVLGEFFDNQLKLNQDYALVGDPVIQIGTIVSRLGSKDIQKHIFVYGSCDDIEGASVHSYKTEKEMLLGWCKWVYNQGIDVLLGYNVFGFDEHYMWDRFCFHRIEKEEVVQKLNRLYSLGTPMALESKELSSSAMGQNFLHLWKTNGILRVDLFQYIKRNVNLDSYKLDNTSRYFLGEEPVKVQDNDDETWTVYTKAKKSQKPEVGRSVVFVNDVGVTLCNKVPITQVLEDGSFVVQAPDDVEILDIDKWAVVKDDLSPEEMFRLHEGSSRDRAVIASYCIQDCQLVLDLFHKLEVFNNSMSMANVCSVPISYIFLRGQGIKIESLIFKFCYENDQCIEVLPNPNENGTQESYEGAIVLDPNPGFYTVPVGVADFASLYPSTIISENISHDTLVWSKDYDLEGNFKQFAFGSDAYDNQDGVLYTDISFDIIINDPEDTRKNPNKIKAGTRICRYAQEKVGTIPLIVAKLLAQRKSTRKKIASEPDPFRKALLDAEQLAYKVTANSLYGQLGANTFKIRLQHLAASVTAYGRKQIMFARDMIMEFYGPKAQNPRCTARGAETVYGDTDSLFICFNPKDPATGKPLEGRAAVEATIHLTEEAGKLVSQVLKPPHDFEFDKVYWPFLIFSKKRYVGNMYESGPDEYVQKSMGIALKRRDYSQIVKKVFGTAVKIMLEENNVIKSADFVKQACTDLVNGKYGINKLIISKSLRGDYAKPEGIPHKILADRIAARDPGNAPAVGDRMSYVYILPPPGQQVSKLQGDRIETPQYVSENKLKLDYMYYIEHQISNPVCQLFGLLLEQLPGFQGPPSGGWNPTPEKALKQRESMAYDIIFRDANNASTSNAIKAFGEKFGWKVLPKTSASSSSPRTVAVTPVNYRPITNGGQSTLDVFLMDKMLIKSMGKKPKKKDETEGETAPKKPRKKAVKETSQ